MGTIIITGVLAIAGGLLVGVIFAFLSTVFKMIASVFGFHPDDDDKKENKFSRVGFILGAVAVIIISIAVNASL